ncbi:MAG TPA: hypothetical protein VED37_03815 [Ktedonobacteraceae bacterium]|nr:hypothetical protein [Ktedonobacteraceae bacterium]
MRTHHFACFFFLLSGLLLLSACGTQTVTTLRKVSQDSKNAATPATALQNQCPASGTARRVTMPLLAQGSHQNIIYIENQQSTDIAAPGVGSLKRYDVTTHLQSDIIKQAGDYIDQAVVSSDGQWLLFVSDVGTFYSIQAKLQLVRIDGQYLQTLYCSSPGQGIGTGIENVQWSPDQLRILFKADINDYQKILLLNLANGQIQQAIVANTFTDAFAPEFWLDPTHVYLSSGPAGTDTFYLLDTSKGVNQPVSDLQRISGQSIGRSYDGKQLFTSRYMLLQNDSCVASTGPSSLSVENVTGGGQKIIYSNPKLAVIAIQAISRTSLLIALQNGTCDANANVDFSQNGLWVIKTDGSDARRLTPGSAGEGGSLNQFSQDLWSDISRDGSMYTWQTVSYSSQNPDAPKYELMYGMIGGGTLIPFASAAHWTQLALVGWTTA